MMNIIVRKILYASILMLFIVFDLTAQQMNKKEGFVYDAINKKPLANVLVSSRQAKESVMTDDKGCFVVELSEENSVLTFTNQAYITKEVVVGNRKKLNVYITAKSTYLAGEGYTVHGRYNNINDKAGATETFRLSDLNISMNTPDEALYGKVAGLRAITKGGMPGEGAALFNRGIRSLHGENNILIVIDGMPYLPSMASSSAVDGFSKNIFSPTNIKEMGRISFLRGAEAAKYGSLGSNGVMLIETESATDMDTRVELQTVEGMTFLSKRLPVLGNKDAKAYLADIGETKYSDPKDLLEALPFLSDNPEDASYFMYQHNTDWQDEIYLPAMVSENMLKIKGGDAVAKYMFSAGTQQNKGVMNNTHLSKYFTRLNANVNFSDKLNANIVGALNYSDYRLQEQGMVHKTNPMLAALYQAPFMSTYQQTYDEHGEVMTVPFYNPVHKELQQSNPLAITDGGIDAKSRSYDIFLNLGLNYMLSRNLNAEGVFSLSFDQTKDDIFISGKNRRTIAILQDGLAENTVRSSVSRHLAYYGRFGLNYSKTFNSMHDFSASIGGQILSVGREYDGGSGVNSPTDFYTTLENATFAKKAFGEMEDYTWMNYYMNADYVWAKQLSIGFGLSLDGASSYGVNSGSWFVLPSVQAMWRLKENAVFVDMDFLSQLNLRGEYAMNANSRFSSKYGKYAFTSVGYMNGAGLYRVGLPNSTISPERILSSNVGVDFALLGNIVNFSVDLYNERTVDMLLDDKQSAVYGYSHRFDNSGEINTNGIEVNMQFNVISTENWNWLLGGNIAHFKSEIKSLGNERMRVTSFEDGSELLLAEGKSPYLFYGYDVEGVYSTVTEAAKYAYIDHAGRSFEAGDVKFRDVDNNKIINKDDKVVIGDPTPDFYGAFYTNLTYKNWNLYMNFTYSYGNDVYNAVRRSTEEMVDFSNQSNSVTRRWIVEGQQTDIPRAVYGDPMDNSRFSSRWIEDGSYLKLKELMLSYTRNKKTWIFSSLKVYASGENLLTFTNYLGMDPEFSYSYDSRLLGFDLGKMPLAKTVKVGAVLNF